MLDATELAVIVDHHLFGLGDCTSNDSAPVFDPNAEVPWLTVLPNTLYFESDDDVQRAWLRIESWDGPALFDAARWPNNKVDMLELPSGELGLDEIAAGQRGDVFTLPGPGSYLVRAAWREEEIDLDNTGRPEAYALAQFWPY